MIRLSFSHVVKEDIPEVVAFDWNPKGSTEVNHEIIFRMCISVRGMDSCKVPVTGACISLLNDLRTPFKEPASRITAEWHLSAMALLDLLGITSMNNKYGSSRSDNWERR